MNVIGIIQTDLNEFSVLFDQQQSDSQDQRQQDNRHSQHQQSGDHNEENDSMFLGFLDENSSSPNNQSAGQNSGQHKERQRGPQEMTVRIKGIPEGQKANFLQMYQILQDAQDTQSLSQSLTIVQQGDDQGQQKSGKGNNNESRQSSNQLQ